MKSSGIKLKFQPFDFHKGNFFIPCRFWYSIIAKPPLWKNENMAVVILICQHNRLTDFLQFFRLAVYVCVLKYLDEKTQGTVLCVDKSNWQWYNVNRWWNMPREARKQSKSGIYHVMLRGINKQQIFEEPEDYEKFIQIIKDCKAISGFKIFAYCLMGNHIHLLIMPETEPEHKFA